MAKNTEEASDTTTKTTDELAAEKIAAEALTAQAVIAVRVLSDFERDGIRYKTNQVAEFDADIVDGLVAGGVADDSVDAVAYAREQA